MSLFAILLGGELPVTSRLRRQMEGARVIAADSGIMHAEALRLAPELWIGDFDSAPAGWEHHYNHIERKIFPPGKDKTDGELAVEEALARGATSLILAGAFGGPRADHAFLHLTLALQLAEAGVPVLLTSGLQEGRVVLHGENRFDLEEGTLFSVLGFSDLGGLSIRGARWPLDEIEMPFGSSLTISNEVLGRLTVTLHSGRAVLVSHHSAD
jgi:thiamine pyrophosphokinase